MESVADRTKRVRKIITRLKKAYPDADCLLHYSTPLELLIATIMSAQCTDERVNKTTPAVFAKYATAADYAVAPTDELEALIRSCGTFRNKAKAIKAACTQIAEKHGGEVPRTMDALQGLDGVGRKTANVVLGTVFGVPAIIIDTHAMRLSGRLALASPHNVKQKYADKIEKELAEVVAPKHQTLFSHQLTWHGRFCCKARKPECPRCPIVALCPYPDKTEG